MRCLIYWTFIQTNIAKDDSVKNLFSTFKQPHANEVKVINMTEISKQFTNTEVILDISHSINIEDVPNMSTFHHN